MSALDDEVEREENSLRAAGRFDDSRLRLSRTRVQGFRDRIAQIEREEVRRYLDVAADRSSAVWEEIHLLREAIDGVLSGLRTERVTTRVVVHDEPRSWSYSSTPSAETFNPHDPSDLYYPLWQNVLNP